MEEAERLIRELLARDPYIEDDYGRSYCFWCYADQKKEHNPNCMYPRAKKWIEFVIGVSELDTGTKEPELINN